MAGVPICAAAIDCETTGVSATAEGSSCAVAKIEPPRMIAPAVTKVAIGSFLFILRIPADGLLPSVSSNHSGFFDVIVDLFR